MKKLIIIFLAVIMVSFISCSTKKSEESQESHADMAAEVDASEALGSDAEILEGMNVYFVNIEDGATVTSPVMVEMGVNGMEVEPAGQMAKHKGHHHIIVDGSFSPKGIVVPADTTHLHFGQGQTSTELTLSPGSHTLTLQFADGFHRSYGEKMSAQISITVE
jgi:hypothetical protein